MKNKMKINGAWLKKNREDMTKEIEI